MRLYLLAGRTTTHQFPRLSAANTKHHHQIPTASAEPSVISIHLFNFSSTSFALLSPPALHLPTAPIPAALPTPLDPSNVLPADTTSDGVRMRVMPIPYV